MKKITFYLLFALCLMLSTNAWAINGFSSFLTNGNGIYDPYSGDINDTPYLYVSLDGLELDETFTVSSFWFDDTTSTANMYFAEPPQDISGTDEVWLALTDPFTDGLYEWSDAGVAKSGDWLIRSSYFTSLGHLGTSTQTLSVGSGTSTVTPEPLSTVLFLAGSLPFAAGLYRRKRQ
jgi:hypothetical protein